MTVVPLYKEKVAFLKRDNLVRSILLFQFSGRDRLVVFS
jgi:hypothetical protein